MAAALVCNNVPKEVEAALIAIHRKGHGDTRPQPYWTEMADVFTVIKGCPDEL